MLLHETRRLGVEPMTSFTKSADSDHVVSEGRLVFGETPAPMFVMIARQWDNNGGNGR